MKIGSNPKASNRLIATSDLQGMNVKLPDPIGKTAVTPVPTQLQLKFNGNRPLQMLLIYGKRLSAALTLRQTPKELELINGDVQFGNTNAAFPKQPGLLVSGYLPTFNWDDWKSILTAGVQSNQTGTSLLRSVDMNFDNLKAFGLSFAKTHLVLHPQSQAWQVQINNSEITGELSNTMFM